MSGRAKLKGDNLANKKRKYNFFFVLALSMSKCCTILDDICSVVPYREQSSVPSKGESEIVPRKPYSPFQQFDGKADFAVARMDDLMNWARKVRCFVKYDALENTHVGK